MDFHSAQQMLPQAASPRSPCAPPGGLGWSHATYLPPQALHASHPCPSLKKPHTCCTSLLSQRWPCGTWPSLSRELIEPKPRWGSLGRKKRWRRSRLNSGDNSQTWNSHLLPWELLRLVGTQPHIPLRGEKRAIIGTIVDRYKWNYEDLCGR